MCVTIQTTNDATLPLLPVLLSRRPRVRDPELRRGGREPGHRRRSPLVPRRGVVHYGVLDHQLELLQLDGAAPVVVGGGEQVVDLLRAERDAEALEEVLELLAVDPPTVVAVDRLEELLHLGYLLPKDLPLVAHRALDFVDDVGLLLSRALRREGSRLRPCIHAVQAGAVVLVPLHVFGRVSWKE